MRYVVRNPFARHTIRSERVNEPSSGCTECGQMRKSGRKAWLLRFHCDDSGRGGPVADGKLFCSRSCAESYIGQSFDERK